LGIWDGRGRALASGSASPRCSQPHGDPFQTLSRKTVRLNAHRKEKQKRPRVLVHSKSLQARFTRKRAAGTPRAGGSSAPARPAAATRTCTAGLRDFSTEKIVHLRYFVEKIDRICDQAEDIADEIQIYAIKRSV